ncbi:unnamed protein product [Closterium sp. NIES-65]|nr:unnamed protein product [Closterium sp. NIES-65]
MWAKQTKQPAAGAEDGSGISTPATAGGSARREDRAGNELLRPSASSDARCSSARHARGVSGSGRNIGESSARYSPRIGDACASFEETIDGKRDEAADGAVTDGASDGASDGGDSDDEFVGLYWTAVEHRQAANAALSTALNRLGVGAKEGRGDACLVGGSTRHGGRSNDAEEFGGGGKVEGLGGRRRRSSSWGNLAESQDPLQAGEGDGSGRFARRQVGQVGCGEGGSGDIATGSGRLGEKETAAAAAAAAAAADFAFPKYGAASNGVACSGDESARPGHRRRHSITCIDTELKELLDLVDLKGEEAAEEAAEEGENGEAAGKSEKEAEHPACREGHQGGMRRNGGNGRNLVRRDTRGRPGAIPTANATVRSPAAAAVASPTGNNPASMRTSNPSPRTHSGQLLANTHAATSASPFARRPARRRSQTCIDTDLKEFLDLIDSDEGDETDEGECVPRDEREGREGGETGKGEGGEGEGRRVSFEFVTPEAASSARRSAAAGAAAAPAAPVNAAAAELLFKPWRPAAISPPALAAASASALAAASASSSALAAGPRSHGRRHSITCIDTELKEFLDLVDQEDDVDEYMSTRVVHLPAPLSTVTDPLVPAAYSARAAAAEERTGSGKTPSGSGSSSSSASVFSIALTPLAPDDLPLGYSASSPTPLSPASLISPSASPLTSPSAAAAVAGFPQHAPAALAPNGGASTPKGGAMAVRAAAGGARRGGCAGGDSSRVGVSRSGGVASLWAAASHNPAIAQSCRRPAAAAAGPPTAVAVDRAAAMAPAIAVAATDRATARPANSLRVNGRRLSAGDLSALLGGSSFETSDSDYTSGYATGYPTKDTGVTMAVDVTSSGGGSSSERSRQMCLNEARRIAGVCYPSLAAGSPAPGPPGPSGPAGPASPPGHLAPLGSVGPHAPPRPASIGKLLGGDITRLSESPRTPPRVGQELPGNALPGSACELFPACGKLLRPGTPGVPSLGGAGRAADGAVSNTVAASSSLAAPAAGSGRISSMSAYSPISAAVQKGACATRPLRETASARALNVNSIAHALETAQLGQAYAKHPEIA